MPRAKAKYDTDGTWKNRQFDGPEWDALTKRLQEKLKPFYPDKSAVVDPAWGHPADQWSNVLLDAANGAVTMMFWHSRRHTNEQLRAEQRDLLDTVKKTVRCLTTVSHDLNVLFGSGVDLLGPRDKLAELIPHIEATKAKITAQPRAQKPNEANQLAAVEMAIRTLRVLKDAGGTVKATAVLAAV